MKFMIQYPFFATILLSLCMGFALTGCAQEQEAATTVAPDMKAFMEADEMPQPMNMVAIYEAIAYPKDMAEAGEGGRVVARILIDEEGNHVQHEILTSSDHRLTKAVDPHIAELTFKPAMKEGKPVKFWVNLPFSFQPSK